MQTQSEGLNFYFEITMYNKSHIEICLCIILCWYRFINDLCYKSEPFGIRWIHQTKASEPFVWATQSRPRKRRRKRGKRAGVLVRLRRRPLRPPLPTILLANVQSLDNKLCELLARISYQRETRDCCIICLTETWMSAVVPDSAIELTGFSVHRSDRTKELTEKSRGGGICFFINNSWCDERTLERMKG